MVVTEAGELWDNRVRAGEAGPIHAAHAAEPSRCMHETIHRALARVPGGLFLISSAFDDRRSGARLLSVQPCARDPLLIAVSLRKGHEVEPLIRDSRAFAVSTLDPSDRLMCRKFPEPPSTEALQEAEEEIDEYEDPFAGVPVATLETGSPLLLKAPIGLDCRVVRHFDLEADHEMYVGRVVAARVEASGGG